MKLKPNNLCGFCGRRVAVTMDHIPPKAIFIKPKPQDLITVRSCFRCNNGSSKVDESFKVYLGLHVSSEIRDGQKIFASVLRTINHNRKLNREVVSRINFDKSGISWENKVHHKSIEKITRGLFFHHYGKAIARKARIKTYWFNKLPDLDLDLNKGIVGEGRFVYYHGKAVETDFDSVWLFDFYGKHWAGAFVTTKRPFSLRKSLILNRNRGIKS